MGVSRHDVIANHLLSEELVECIPEKCECGAELEFTDSLRQVYCPNPKCPYKVAARLESMAKAMKADGWGESTCIEVCKLFELCSPYQVFLLEDFIKNGGGVPKIPAFKKKIENICDPEKRRVQLWEVVKLAGIPSIDTIAYKIFNGYENLTEAFADIETGQVPFIAEKLGIKQTSTGVIAASIYKTLLEYKDELLFGETKFQIYKPQGETLYIAITGGVDGFRNKSEFISYINIRYQGKVNAMLMNSVSTSTHILVDDTGANSGKIKTAKRMNQKYLDDLLQKGAINPADIGQREKPKDILPIGTLILVTGSKELLEVLDNRYRD